MQFSGDLTSGLFSGLLQPLLVLVCWRIWVYVCGGGEGECVWTIRNKRGRVEVEVGVPTGYKLSSDSIRSR